MNCVAGEEKKCCGCSACVNICPENAIFMKKNEKGFLIPQIDMERCVQCGRCTRICPFFSEQNKTGQNIQNTYRVFGLKVRKKRMASQSGGAFTAIAEIFLEQKGIVYGVMLKEKRACYTRITCFKELQRLKGSKYIQAEVLDAFPKVAVDLKSDHRVFFSGTSCHVDGLLRYLKAKNVDLKNLYTCDLICHGVPSPLVFEDYLNFLETQFGKISHYNFRNKLLGRWKGHVESFKSNGQIFTSENFVKIFYSNLILRENCYQCPYASHQRITDITISDFWGIEKTDQKFDDDYGVSMILFNSEKGYGLLEVIKKKAYLKEYMVSQIQQPNLKHPTEKGDNYDAFWEIYQKQGFLKAVTSFCDFDQSDYTEWSLKDYFFQNLTARAKSWMKGWMGNK